jgi:hypothetical protein
MMRVPGLQGRRRSCRVEHMVSAPHIPLLSVAGVSDEKTIFDEP